MAIELPSVGNTRIVAEDNETAYLAAMQFSNYASKSGDLHKDPTEGRFEVIPLSGTTDYTHWHERNRLVVNRYGMATQAMPFRPGGVEFVKSSGFTIKAVADRAYPLRSEGTVKYDIKTHVFQGLLAAKARYRIRLLKACLDQYGIATTRDDVLNLLGEIDADLTYDTGATTGDPKFGRRSGKVYGWNMAKWIEVQAALSAASIQYDSLVAFGHEVAWRKGFSQDVVFQARSKQGMDQGQLGAYPMGDENLPPMAQMPILYPNLAEGELTTTTATTNKDYVWANGAVVELAQEGFGSGAIVEVFTDTPNDRLGFRLFCVGNFFLQDPLHCVAVNNAINPGSGNL